MAQLEQERDVEAGDEVVRISHWIGGRVVAGQSGRNGVVYNPASGRQT
jgi:malonate-semialdehyde dehydrogenase (acetylating)/methylmalonate-semialdehyde dehydrogenase